MIIRETFEQMEQQTLSVYAAHSVDSRGRIRPVVPCDLRTVYQRDRDRIIHSNAFRLLKHKTQVFLAPSSDHYRTRLTHTLEVSQISRTAAKALRLNEDLTEAIALGHDLGHTPFGHVGERALDKLCENGFRHNLQSVRVVELLENEGRGLNLTYELKNGIACHSDDTAPAQTLEGQIVRICDKVAYINHDIEDAVRAGVLRDNDLPYDCLYILGRTKSERITTILRSIVEHSTDSIRMAPEIYKAHLRLKEFMFDEVYRTPAARAQEDKAHGVMEALYDYYYDNPHKLPAFYKQVIHRFGLSRAVCDYIAGMTDYYAVELYKELFIPKFWTR